MVDALVAGQGWPLRDGCVDLMGVANGCIRCGLTSHGITEAARGDWD